MNIAELAQTINAHYKSSGYWPEPDDVAGVVERLGNGSFGCAYLLPDGRVLKVAEGLDATCVWISAAAQHFAMHGYPGRSMPVVWEFSTMVTGQSVHKRELVRHESWVRMPDGSLVKTPNEYRNVEFTYQNVWWYAVMEKVEAHCDVDYTEERYIREWGRDRGIVHTDVYSKNCGTAKDGRFVCFDPFYNEPEGKALESIRDSATPYSGYKDYSHTASSVRPSRPIRSRSLMDVFEDMKKLEKLPAFKAFRVSTEEQAFLRDSLKACKTAKPDKAQHRFIGWAGPNNPRDRWARG